MIKTPEPHLHLESTASGKKKLPPRTALLMLRDIVLVDAGEKDEKQDFTWSFKSGKVGCKSKLPKTGVNGSSVMRLFVAGLRFLA